MNRPFLAGMIALMVASPAPAAQGPKAPPIAPEARARLDALIASYRALPAYADHGEVTLVVKVGERPLKQVQQASIRFARPNRVDVRTDFVRVVGDGSSVTSVVVPLKKFQAIPSPRKLAESSLRGGPLGAIEFGNLAGLPLVHVLNLVIGDEPDRLIQDFTPNILVEPDQMVDGTAYRVLRLDESDNHDWRFLIDPKTGLLGFVDLVVEGDATRSSVAGGTTHVESLRWASGAVSTEPLGADAFRFQPPDGFTGVARLEGAAKAGAPAAAHPLVGKPAPDFSVDVLEGPGKTRKVGPKDLLGKVVLLDFWATWCGPCLEELPDVQKLIDGYAKARKDVVVLALSIDQSELGEIAEVRAKVEQTLKDRKLTLTAEGQAVGLIGLDPLNAVAKAYGAGAIPFVVLIDAKGVVRAVHVGLTEGSVFAAEIEALLAGKDL